MQPNPTATTEDPMLDLALSYVARGWAVFPCRASDEETIDYNTGEITVFAAKTPLTPTGFRGATKNERVIRELWRRNPGAMVGIPTGADTGVWVLDIDTKHDGQDTLAELESTYGPLPDTAISSTANHGRHYFFKHVEGVRNRGALGFGIDVRGSGGYVVAAGSELEDGRSYAWVADREPADAPQWLLDLVLPKQYDAHPKQAPRADNNNRYVESAVQAELDKLASTPQGSRNNQLNDSAFSLGTFVGAGALPEQEARSLLQGVVAGWPNTPLSHKTIENGLAGGQRNPRHIPEPTRAIDTDKHVASALSIIGERLARITATAPEPAPEPEPTPEPKPEVMTVINPSDWQGKPIPHRDWYIDDLIPSRNVTLLSGDGGLGKSLVAVQIGIASALDMTTIGVKPKAGRVFYLGAEDDADEFQRRMASVLSSYGCSFEDLGNRFKLAPLAGTDATLALPDKTKTMQPTAMMLALLDQVEDFRPELVVLDTSADLFGGEEINRTQVRQFVGMLRKIAMDNNCAVLLLSHPSLSGMASGSGLSGSTAWNNSVRSRLYLTAVDGEDDSRLLTNVKSNYGKKGAEIKITWEDGMFAVEDKANRELVSGILEANTDAFFIRMLSKFNRDGDNLSDSKTSIYFAPKFISEHVDAEGYTPEVLNSSMRRLIKAGTIKTVSIKINSKNKKKLVVSSEFYGPDQS